MLVVMTAPPRIGSLFSGYGGLDLAVHAVLGADPVWFCEYEPPTRAIPRPRQAAARVLARHWPGVPNHGDVTSVDWTTLPMVDVLTGGFPCQDLSQAGHRAGLGPGTRSGLWNRMATAIATLRPGLVVAENVRGLLSAEADRDVEPCPWCLGDTRNPQPAVRALGAVLADLADLGYDAAWHGLRAADIGAPHPRYRIFLLAWPADPDGSTGGQRRGTAPGQAPCRRAPTDPGRRDRTPATDSDRHPVRSQSVADPGRVRPLLAGRAVPDSPSQRRHQGRTTPARQPRRSDAACGSGLAVAWGRYEPAIRRWEHVLDRPAPSPTEPVRGGAQRLSPRFVEWLMGLPGGWVTDVPGLTRAEQLHVLGNGVVPQQATAALRLLLAVARR